MAKVICKEFPKLIKNCIKKPHVDVIKTRKNGVDSYFYEISAEGVAPFVLDPKDSRPQGDYPDLEDTWCGGQWPGEKYNGCDYDVNIFDKSVYGDDDNTPGLVASICSCYQAGDYASTDSDDCVKATVKCWFQDTKGKRTEFICNTPDTFLSKFGEWDGTPIFLPKLPDPNVFKEAKKICKKLEKFLKKHKLELNYEMADDNVYILPKNGWDDATRDDVLKAMKSSGEVLDHKTNGKKWGWLRGSTIDDNWFCNKGGK